MGLSSVKRAFYNHHHMAIVLGIGLGVVSLIIMCLLYASLPSSSVDSAISSEF